jgi:REP element-mobilizing transposase RayT
MKHGANSYSYRRRLPHIQKDDRPMFVTFRTWSDFVLPESVRDLLFSHCLHDHGTKLRMHALVIMPTHVHLLFSALRDAQGEQFKMGLLLQSIKGASAHTINKVLRRSGPVWQEESFDHVLRSSESLEEKVEYICNNPVRARLARTPSEYRWLWHEGQQREKPRAGAPAPHGS